MRLRTLLAGLLLLIWHWDAVAEEEVGQRPYEMVWANRTKDTRPPLVDFENLDGWTVECQKAVAELTRSRQQQLWGKYVGKLVYRGEGPSPTVTMRPPKPVEIATPFDCVNLWVYGNNWAWSVDKTTPQVEILVLLKSRDGKPVRVSMGRVRWKEWWLMHRRLNVDQIAALKQGAFFEGIEIRGGRNKDDRLLFFDNLAVYKESLPPLAFEPRPKRGIEPFPGQSTGTNTGPGRLPFPTRDETILPDNLAPEFKVRLEKSADTFAFHYEGKDGHLVYRYKPATGTLGDVTAEWTGGKGPIEPMADGGVYFQAGDKAEPIPPKTAKLVRCEQLGDTVQSTWQCEWDGRTAEVTYTFRLWQKSLVVDVKCAGGVVGEFRVGRAVGAEKPRLVTVPYLVGSYQARPAVLVTGPPDQPLFVTALVDHTRSNGSLLFFVNKVADDGATYNGGSRYLPKTDGRRNHCFERLFLTVSPRFEEVLPNIPNPKSPWMHVTGERLWRAHGASNRESDYAYWKNVARYGMTKVVITDHETGWRDGGESFTMRTRAAPGKGGDEGQAEYARKIIALGFRYGPYNNYTDYAPVNEHWNEDWVTRLSDGDWRRAWARCYNPKPARVVEVEPKLTAIIQEKFHFNTAYCDVHTAVTPWRNCDFDVRVPGAGTFAATFYAYGEIMLHQKKVWNGPVYSEGNNHWYYCGLTDGNYAQDQAAKLAEKPWLVDFDLRKMHPLCCNFGMGNLGMFFGRRQNLGNTPEQPETRLNQFLAATLAFGHTGFLVRDGGTPNTVRSYFSLQQIHARYAQETATEIRYADAEGNLLDTSAAVATGAFRRSQIATRYSNGLEVLVNGHPSETWKTPHAVLPPYGWWAGDKEGKLIAFSALVDGRRVDYVDSPAYIYADGRGRFTRFDKAACDGQLIAHIRENGTYEVIPVGKCPSFGISLGGRTAAATALDKEGKPIGPAETRLSRGLVHVVPVDNAFSYLLKPGPAPKLSLKCPREEVIPGETVSVTGKTEHTFRAPADATPGARLWQKLDGAWVDFTVVPLVDARLRIDGPFRLELVSYLPTPTDAEVTFAGQSLAVNLAPGENLQLEFPFQPPGKEEVRRVLLRMVAGDLSHQQQWWLKTEEAVVPVAAVPEAFEAGQCFRKKSEEPLDGASGGQVHRREMSCGDVAKRGIFMHPPYKTGVGYAFALMGPLTLPAAPTAVFRCLIGKGDWSDPGDGILFRVAVLGPDGKETVVTEKQWIKHAWTPLEADLSPWAGKKVRMKLIADVGPADNSSGDWACWANPRIESAQPVLVSTLHDQPVQLRHVPGPHPVEGLTTSDLKKAKKGILHYQGIGLQGAGDYISKARLNKIPLGNLPGAGGVEGKGKWSDASLPLTPEAIVTLQKRNHFAVSNPDRDCFKIGRVWLELELADRRKCSSDIATTVYTQPPEWLHAEGTGVPFDQDIRVQIRFRVE